MQGIKLCLPCTIYIYNGIQRQNLTRKEKKYGLERKISD